MRRAPTSSRVAASPSSRTNASGSRAANSAARASAYWYWTLAVTLTSMRIAGEHARLEIGTIEPAQIDGRDGLDGPGQMPTGAARPQACVGTEMLHHAGLAVFDLVKARAQPQQ